MTDNQIAGRVVEERLEPASGAPGSTLSEAVRWFCQASDIEITKWQWSAIERELRKNER